MQDLRLVQGRAVRIVRKAARRLDRVDDARAALELDDAGLRDRPADIDDDVLPRGSGAVLGVPVLLPASSTASCCSVDSEEPAPVPSAEPVDSSNDLPDPPATPSHTMATTAASKIASTARATPPCTSRVRTRRSVRSICAMTHHPPWVHHHIARAARLRESQILPHDLAETWHQSGTRAPRYAPNMTASARARAKT